MRLRNGAARPPSHKAEPVAPISAETAQLDNARRPQPADGVALATALRRKGVEGLSRDKTRKPGKAPIAADKAAQLVAPTCTAPPHQATHWTGRAMAKAIGISVGSVQRIWRAHKLQPHRLRTSSARAIPALRPS
jgi:hypothetical protein